METPPGDKAKMTTLLSSLAVMTIGRGAGLVYWTPSHV